MNDELTWWQRHGYIAGKHLEHGVWIVLMPMITTYRLAVCTESSVLDFFCYPYGTTTRDQAMAAFDAWDGQGEPADGWVKHHATGRRRALVS